MDHGRSGPGAGGLGKGQGTVRAEGSTQVHCSRDDVPDPRTHFCPRLCSPPWGRDGFSSTTRDGVSDLQCPFPALEFHTVTWNEGLYRPVLPRRQSPCPYTCMWAVASSVSTTHCLSSSYLSCLVFPSLLLSLPPTWDQHRVDHVYVAPLPNQSVDQ